MLYYLLLIYTDADSMNYLRYPSWCSESIQPVHVSHLDVFEQFKAKHMFVVKTNTGSFNAAAPDIYLFIYLFIYLNLYLPLV